MKLSDITDELLEDVLPHGSGIDARWEFSRLKNGAIICRNGFHGMDEYGYYDGWQEFYVKLFEHKQDKLNSLSGPLSGKVQVLHRAGDLDFEVHLSGYRQPQSKAWTYELKSYLSESMHYALFEAKILTNRHEVIEAENLSQAPIPGLIPLHSWKT
jgi:hypothetical protein